MITLVTVELCLGAVLELFGIALFIPSVNKLELRPSVGVGLIVARRLVSRIRHCDRGRVRPSDGQRIVANLEARLVLGETVPSLNVSVGVSSTRLLC
jgi:hypothetical protein